MPPLNSEVQHQGNPLLELMINLHPGRVDVDEGKVAAAGIGLSDESVPGPG